MNLFYILPIFLVKRIFLQSVYLHIIFPIIGIFHLFIKRSIASYLFPLFIVSVLSFIQSIFLGSVTSFIRGGQFLCLIFFADFVFRNFKQKSYHQFFQASLYYGLSINFFSLLLSPTKLHFKNLILALKIPMFNGIIGEPNFSGLFYLGALGFFVHNKEKNYTLLSLLLIVMSASRSMILTSLLILPILILQSNSFERLLKWLSRIILSFVILYPGLLMMLYKVSDNSLHIFYTKVTSARFAIHSVYASIFLKNPFGIGLSQGRNQFNLYKEGGLATFPINKMEINNYNYETHSMFMQVLSELGIVSYILFIYFLVSIYKELEKVDVRLSYIFTAFFLPFTQLNGLNEIILYLFLGYCLHIINQKRIISNYTISGKSQIKV